MNNYEKRLFLNYFDKAHWFSNYSKRCIEVIAVCAFRFKARGRNGRIN